MISARLNLLNNEAQLSHGLDQMSEEVNSYDNFPVGMRVLDVDEDPIRLKLIEGLLLKCQYSVSTTNQAIVALYMLRENQDRFDLVITEVHLPDMDGFKLLELIELETDLPVIINPEGETPLVQIESRDVHGWSSDGESQQNTNPNPQQPPTTLQIVLFVLLPWVLTEYIASALLTMLVKLCGGIYPIAVGTVWRRLVYKAILHALNRFVEERDNDVGLSILLVDFENAFNMVDCGVMLSEVRRHCPVLSHWVEFCYSAPARLDYGEHSFLSSQGVQQGDPLGPLLFILVAYISVFDSRLLRFVFACLVAG
ncbi:hypothetical protein OROMI_001773 [Orobanche minor]